MPKMPIPRYRPTVSLILASGSPRRRALLEELGMSFVVHPADIDETPFPSERPIDHVERLARGKAAAVRCAADDVVLAADTIVTIDGDILGKPVDHEHARAMLRRLSGHVHQVLTGVAIRRGDTTETFVEATSVHFDTITDAEIEWYVSTGEPNDKAGAYALQGRGGAFVTSIDGSYDNVIGLPRYRLRQALSAYLP